MPVTDASRVHRLLHLRAEVLLRRPLHEDADARGTRAGGSRQPVADGREGATVRPGDGGGPLVLAPLPAPQPRDLVVELAPHPLGSSSQPLVVTPLVGLGLAFELPVVLQTVSDKVS